MAEEAVVREHELAQVAFIRQSANVDGELFVQLLGAVVHPRDADVVDLQDGAAPADLGELLEARLDEDVAEHHLARIGRDTSVDERRSDEQADDDERRIDGLNHTASRRGHVEDGEGYRPTGYAGRSPRPASRPCRRSRP